MVAIRSMTADDVPRVAALEISAALFAWEQRAFAQCLQLGCICRVAIINGIVVGFGLMNIQGVQAHILNLCVDPDVRGQGIGRALLEHLVTMARLTGADHVFLEARPSNAAAINLYRSVGFQQVGNRVDYYPAVGGREDGAIYALRLKS